MSNPVKKPEVIKNRYGFTDDQVKAISDYAESIGANPSDIQEQIASVVDLSGLSSSQTTSLAQALKNFKSNP